MGLPAAGGARARAGYYAEGNAPRPAHSIPSETVIAALHPDDRDHRKRGAPAAPTVGAAVNDLAGAAMPPAHDLRGVLAIRPFRQLYIALALSSFGDWLGLLATTALATSLTTSFQAKSFALGGVLVVRLLPALALGPLAGALADRLDRRKQMVVADVIRFGLFASIPIVHTLPYLLVASFLIEAVSLFWIPAKDASVPNLVPRHRLEAANQLSLITTYGSAAPAAAVFALLAKLSAALALGTAFFANPVDLALYFDAMTFLFSAITIFRLPEISGHHVARRGVGDADQPSLLRSIREGWAFVGRTPLVRGLIVGIVGAFAAGAVIIATGKLYAAALGGGDAAYGVLFGGIFLGLAAGMGVGPRLLRGLSRKRLFGLALVGAGLSVVGLALVPNLILAVVLTVFVGAFAGVAWVTGYTLIGLEVADEMRGRTFAFLQSLVRIDLLLVLASVPFVVGLIGMQSVRAGPLTIQLDGVTVVLLAGGLVGVVVGVLAFRQMDDRRGVPLWKDVIEAMHVEVVRTAPTDNENTRRAGLFVALEGGEGAGKSTQAQLLAEWLSEAGYEVVLTREPGGTELGERIRALLLDRATVASPRTEALLYAADRAEHVAAVITPALERGAVVLTDRYVDSSLAYQGAGRHLDHDEVARLSKWATAGLQPDVTVLLDVDPAVGLARSRGTPDRIEVESGDFHARVRRGFLDLAKASPTRYLVLPAAAPVEQVHERLKARLADLLGSLPRDPVAAPVPATAAFSGPPGRRA